jgi:Zn-dependent M28 family amino/carboxypeptidase
VLATTVGRAAPGGANATTSAQCNNQVNNTAAKLLPCIRTNDLQKHMQALQAIADANPGPDGHPSRNAGEPGYKASADYVAAQMQQAGYDVKIQTYKFPYFAFSGTPVLREVAPTAHDFSFPSEWVPGQSLGTTTADIQPAGGIVLPPTPTSSSKSGCTPADFAGFTPGRIALVQRGFCAFGTKAVNAQAAGAAGVILFNEGNPVPGRTGVFGGGSLSDDDGNPVVPNIPVGFVPFATGSSLLTEYQHAVAAGTALPSVNLSVQGVYNPAADDYNVIAESKDGDPNNVVVVDAHLDAIYGAGMLDNASGSVTILDIAQKMRKVHPRNKLRFIWFGGEELGLLGSSFYVNNLTPNELGRIGYDLDADVTSTPNYIIGVLDPAGVDLFGRTVSTTFPTKVYEPSKIARDQIVDYFDTQGFNHELFSPVGTDAFNFNMAGIPASGVLTGQDCCKTQDEVNLFGGYVGNYEGRVPSSDGGCVDLPFRWCDNLGNNDFALMTFVSRAFANSVIQMAFKKNLAARPPAHKPGKPTPAQAGVQVVTK